MNRWIGKVAIVTGASSGIGAAIAERLVDDGLLVVGLARRMHLMEKLAEKLDGRQGKFHPIQTDVTHEDQLVAAFEWAETNLGPIGILVNNAAVIHNTNLIEGDTEKWRTTYETNTIALLVATREAVKRMRANGIDGHVVHINSIGGHVTTYVPKFNVYGSTKFALTNLNECFRQELEAAGTRIKVSSVSPGYVRTDLARNLELTGSAKEIEKKMVALKCEDVADAVAYVISTPPNVQIHDIIIKPLGEKYLNMPIKYLSNM